MKRKWHFKVVSTMCFQAEGHNTHAFLHAGGGLYSLAMSRNQQSVTYKPSEVVDPIIAGSKLFVFDDENEAFKWRLVLTSEVWVCEVGAGFYPGSMLHSPNERKVKLFWDFKVYNYQVLDDMRFVQWPRTPVETPQPAAVDGRTENSVALMNPMYGTYCVDWVKLVQRIG